MRKMIRRPLVILVCLALLVSAAIQWLPAQWLPFGEASPLTSASTGHPVSRMPTATDTPIVTYSRPDFQTGVVFPQWGASGYSDADPDWSAGLAEIRQQTAARWIQLDINFVQDTSTSNTIEADSAKTPTPESVRQGIIQAHNHGEQVFMSPLITLRHPTPQGSYWAGDIHCYSLCSQWFASYLNAYLPYLRVAQETSVEQVSLGTEYGYIELASPSLWTQFIAQVHSVYTGKLTYDVNFTTIEAHGVRLADWMRDPLLSSIGISAYWSLVDQPIRVAPNQMPALWKKRVESWLDQISIAMGKPVLIAEIGYRNSADALYDPYASVTDAPPDPQEQAGAYAAALEDVIEGGDRHIQGIYFWAWSQPPFAPNNLPAAAVLHQWYMSPLA
jgi:hypothetical protein